MAETVTSPVKTKKKKFPVKKLAKRLVIIAVVAAVALFGLRRFWSARKNQQSSGEPSYENVHPQRRTITSAITGSGTLQPANSYTVTTLVQGDILSDTFEEGDLVEEGAVLYVIDSSDASTNIEKAQINLGQAQRNYQKSVSSRYVTSDVAGQIWSLNVKEGDKINNGQVIAQVRDSSTMLLKVSFPADDAAGFYVGQAAQITLDGSFETLTGTVDAVAAADTVSQAGQMLRTVSVSVKNPGGLAAGQAASVSINGVNCAAGGAFTYASEGTINATASGTVTKLEVCEGDLVRRGQSVLTLGGDDLENSIQNAQDSLRNAQLSMDNTKSQLDNYTVTAPVTGTVVDKAKKAGETISNTNGGPTLCVIYDLSYLEMTLDIDELDINKIAVGQSVAITADAVGATAYEGVITKVSVVGTTSMGITSYPATIRIDQTDGLLPGMNVDATIVISQARDALAVPAAAVSRGNRVLVTKDSPSAASAIEDERLKAPEGYVYVQVETGQSDDNYIQITSGLTEEDTVAYVSARGNANETTGMPAFGMMGGMPGGGIPGGGMPGGMPGGMSGNRGSGSGSRGGYSGGFGGGSRG